MTKKQVIISVGLALVIISAIIFLPAFLSAKHEDNAAAQLSELYNDKFVVTKSTASAFSKEFEVTVQSETSKIVYDFDVKDEKYTGTYYEENVNAKVNELIQPLVAEGTLVMSNVFQEGLTADISLEEAQVTKATIHLLVEENVTEQTAQKIAEVLKGQFGDIAVDIAVYVVDEERVFDGVKVEVQNFFQLSEINAKSFVDFKFHEQTFNF